MIGCLRTCVHKQPIIAFYFESENELKFNNLEARAANKPMDNRVKNMKTETVCRDLTLVLMYHVKKLRFCHYERNVVIDVII